MNYGFVNDDNRLYVNENHYSNPIKVTNPFYLSKISETCFKLKNIMKLYHYDFSNFPSYRFTHGPTPSEDSIE